MRIIVSILVAAFLFAGWGPPANRIVFATSTQTDDWVPLPVPTAPGGTVLDLAVSPAQPDLLFALIQDISQTRLYRSTDAAQSWEQIFSFDAYITSIALDPASPQSLYVGGSDGLLFSADGGQTWTLVSPLGQVVAAPAPGRIYAGGIIPDDTQPDCPQQAVVARSDNYGAAWEQTVVGCVQMLTLIQTEPGNPQTVYVGTSADRNRKLALWRSQDAGHTWTRILPAVGIRDDLPGHWLSLAIDPENPARLFVQDSWGGLVTEDRGGAWREAPPLPPESNNYSLAVQGGRLYAAAAWADEIHVFYSNNWGQSWWQSVARLPAGANRLAPDPHTSGRLYAGLQDYGVWRSDLSGSDWRDSNQGMRSPVDIQTLAVEPSNPAHWVAGALEGRPGLFETYDGGLTWTQVIMDIRFQTAAIHPAGSDLVYAGGPDGVFYRDFSGMWVEALRGFEFKAADINFSAHSEPWVLVGGAEFITSNGEGGIMIRRPDEVYGWHWGFSNLPTAGRIGAIAGDPHNPDALFAAQGHPGIMYGSQQPGRVWRSLDGGRTWQEVHSNAVLSAYDLLVDPYHPGWVYVAGFNGLLVSQDGGDTWRLSRNNFDPASWPMTALAMDELGVLFGASDKNGVFRWDPWTDSWYSEGLTGMGVNTLQYIPGPNRALIAGGYKRLWRRDLGPVYRVYLTNVWD